MIDGQPAPAVSRFSSPRGCGHSLQRCRDIRVEEHTLGCSHLRLRSGCCIGSSSGRGAKWGRESLWGGRVSFLEHIQSAACVLNDVVTQSPVCGLCFHFGVCCPIGKTDIFRCRSTPSTVKFFSDFYELVHRLLISRSKSIQVIATHCFSGCYRA